MKTSREFKIGLVATITLVLTVLGLNFLKGRNLLSPNNTYYIVYNNAADLKESAFVNIYGMKVGLVAEIEPKVIENKTKIIVQIDVEKGLKIPKDSYADLYSYDLLGTKAIRLIAGESATPFTSGDTIPGKFTPGLTEQMDNIINEVNSVLANLDSVSARINTVFSGENAQKIDNTINNLNGISGSVNDLVADNGAITNSIKSLEKTLSVIERNNKSIENTISNLETFSDSLKQLEFNKMVDSSILAISQANIMLENINTGQGTLGQLAANDSLYLYLTRSTESLNKLLIDLKENPKDYVHFSIFGNKE